MGNLKDKLPTLLVMNKKDLIKPGEIAKKLQVRTCLWVIVLTICITALVLTSSDWQLVDFISNIILI